MASRVGWMDLLVAVIAGVAFGGGIGYGLGILARNAGWSTSFVAPLTGAMVGAAVPVLYQLLRRRRGSAGSGAGG